MDALTSTLITEQGGDRMAHYLPADRSWELAVEGKAQAVCGRVFLPAALTAPIGAPCPLCEAVLELALPRY